MSPLTEVEFRYRYCIVDGSTHPLMSPLTEVEFRYRDRIVDGNTHPLMSPLTEVEFRDRYCIVDGNTHPLMSPLTEVECRDRFCIARNLSGRRFVISPTNPVEFASSRVRADSGTPFSAALCIPPTAGAEIAAPEVAGYRMPLNSQ
jgi:hypothetical protein